MSFEGLLPILVALTAICALFKKTDAYTAMITGAGDGVHTILRIFPALLALLFAVNILRISGAYDFMCTVFAPVLSAVGIPKETAPLILIRPISGSGALAIATDLIVTHGPDSLIGKTAAVMMGSTETTFYAISVYLGSRKIAHTWKIVLSAVLADVTGFVCASFFVRLFLFR